MNRESFDRLPDDALVRRAAVTVLTGGQHPCTLARWSRSGAFPAPLALPGGQVAYRARDLRAWLANLRPVREEAPL